MDRTTGANHVDIGGGKRGFRDRNKAAGIAGTILNAAFANMIQEELMAFLAAAGITPNAANFGQVLAAATALFEAKLGFTPVRQGGGPGQGTNQINLGWDGARLRAAVDNVSHGQLALVADITAEIAARIAADDLLFTSINDVNNARLAVEADLYINKQNNLGFTPARQRTGHITYLGWDGSSLDAQVDSTYLGKVFTAQSCPATFAGSGRQMLANGWIIQWGESAATVVGNSTTNIVGVVFPVTFPNGILFGMAGLVGAEGGCSASFNSGSASGGNLHLANLSNGTKTLAGKYIVIGH